MNVITVKFQVISNNTSRAAVGCRSHATQADDIHVCHRPIPEMRCRVPTRLAEWPRLAPMLRVSGRSLSECCIVH